MAITEVFKDILGYEGKYQVSNLGNIRSMNYNHCNGKIKNLNPSIDKGGYPYVNILGKKFKVYRLVAQTFIGIPKSKLEVNHKDGNKLNNNVSNLEWLTHKENIQHAWKTGLSFIGCGDKSHNHKLTDKEVIEIRNIKKNSSILQKDIAILYNISERQISRIVNNTSRMGVLA